MKETLVTKYAAIISPFIINNTIKGLNYKEAVKSIHRTSVNGQFRGKPPTKFSEYPPKKKIKTLPRRTRTLLSQLRSGYSTHLNFLSGPNQP